MDATLSGMHALSRRLLGPIHAIWLVSACAHAPAPASNAPAVVLGEFVDDYGIAYTITREQWQQHPDTRYIVERWADDGRSLVARNHADNPTDAGLWSRIEWVELPDEQYPWAFCITAWNAKTMEAAAATKADATQPKTGCGGFPFSRMTPK